jgi:hypothetical protein
VSWRDRRRGPRSRRGAPPRTRAAPACGRRRCRGRSGATRPSRARRGRPRRPHRAPGARRSRAACRGRPAGMLQVGGRSGPGAAAAGRPRSDRRGSRPREPGWPPPWRTRPGDAPHSRWCGATGRSPAGLPAAGGGGATRWAGFPSRGDTRRRLRELVPDLEACTARHEDGGRVRAITARPADLVKPLIHPRRWHGRHVLALMLVPARGTRNAARPSSRALSAAVRPARGSSLRWMIPGFGAVAPRGGPAGPRARLPLAGPSGLEREPPLGDARGQVEQRGARAPEAPRSWPTPGSRWSDVGAGIAARALRARPPRRTVYCSVDEERRRVEAGSGATLSSAGRLGGWRIGEQQERSRQARLVRGQEARLAAPV